MKGEKLQILKEKFDEFLILAEKNIYLRPWLVIMLMHEYFRNLFPADPHIPFTPGISHTERISLVLDKSIELFKIGTFLGSYFEQKTDLRKLIEERLTNYKSRTEGRTQQVYDMLWKKFDTSVYLEEAKKIVSERFKNSGFSFSSLKDKIILDLGCGSGRYTIALALLTNARKVHEIE